MSANIIIVVARQIRLTNKAQYEVAYIQSSRINGSWYGGHLLGVF